MTKETIKPCPNCEGEALWYDGSHVIRCEKCPMCFNDWEISKDKLIDLWNSLPRKENK